MRKTYLMFLAASFILFGCGDNIKFDIGPSGDSNVESTEENKPEHVLFPSLDSVDIAANVYEIDETSPVIVLCHQARFNKFEYDGIAQKLNERGYNCIAIDQRSGGPIASHVNETTLNAEAKGKSTDYLEAEQDINAAVAYAAKRYNQKVILWGSSYSSTLVLYVAIENDQVNTALAFSPGDYFAEEKGSLVDKLSTFKKPLFIASSKNEAPEIEALISKMDLSENQIHFTPEGDGHHGSRALWNEQSGGDEYWEALDEFLQLLKK